MNEKEKMIYEAKANVFKALAHPTRLWMIEKLASGECCVCEFANEVDADFSTISKHLTVLRQAGIVKNEKRGKKVYYQLMIPCVLKFMNCVEEVIEFQIKTQLKMLNNN